MQYWVSGSIRLSLLFYSTPTCPPHYYWRQKPLGNQINFISSSPPLIIQMESKPSNHPETIKEDHFCAICLAILFNPAKLSRCKHIFCQLCLTESTLIIENMRCPLCRTPFSQNEMIGEGELWKQLQEKYPLAVAQKRKYVRERVTAKFLVGNRTQFLQTNEDNRYRWTLFVRPAPGEKNLSETVKRIVVKLHPTFRPPNIEFEISGGKTVELSRIGWGTFRIQIQIHWKDLFVERMSEIYHDLEFEALVEKTVHTFLTLKPVA